MAILDATVVSFSPLELERLTSLGDINKLLQETVSKERSIELELEGLLSKRSTLERSLSHLQASTRETIEVIKADAGQLAQGVHSTSELSERVSQKIRQLDTAQSRVHSALGRIGVIVDRSNAVDGVRSALEAEDFEKAANCLKAYFDLEEQQPSSDKDVLESQQAEDQRRMLLDAKKQLQEVIEKRLADAASQDDHATVLRYVHLYAPLQLKEAGVRWLASYFRSAITKRAVDRYDQLVETTGQEPDFVGVLVALFGDISAALDRHRDFLTEHFGPDACSHVALALHEECDEHGERLLDRYIKFRRLAQLVRDIASIGSLRQAGGNLAAEASLAVDPRQVEAYLEEMLLLCSRSEEYNLWMLQSLAAFDVSQALAASSEQEKAFRSGPFNVLLRQLIAYYINLEEFYLEQNVAKAISIDEFTGDALTTSLVDDVFFILQKVGRRSLATASVQCICAVLTQLNSLLASDLRLVLDTRWKAASTKLPSAAPTDTGPDAHLGMSTPAVAEQAAAFNNADISSGYVAKLRKQLEDACADIFSSTDDRERIKSVLSDLSKTAADFKQIVTRAAESFVIGLMPRVRPVLDEVAGVSYELSEAQYAANEREDTWSQRLLGSLVRFATWLQPLTTGQVFDTILGFVIDRVLERLEAAIQLKHFSQLGGLQLDRDVRLMLSTLSDLTQKPLRDKFSRLAQTAILLSLETLSEVGDVWGEGGGAITWRLTEAQARAVLAQRIDFSPQQVAALNF
ncbi:hypothetical protein WJX74_001770 [Apatococcus lobatus]|uniref:Conserved oligomeric Golgi complex subunit 4 n=1 Tax=Apatococcus lobatus TaxID=904363 RepID=A0AAW1R3H5_9CHLO